MVTSVTTTIFVCFLYFINSIFSDENEKGIKIFNLEEETLIRHIPCDYATDVDIYGDILMVSGNYWMLGMISNQGVRNNNFWSQAF